MSLFLRIGQAGITLVTLMDGRTHRPEDTDIGGLMMSLMSMHNAHEESQKKSVRVGAAWKNKRALAASGKPMTARCPGWLRLSAADPIMKLSPSERTSFGGSSPTTLSGVGMWKIAKQLNDADVPAFEGKNGWHQSSVNKMLDNRP